MSLACGGDPRGTQSISQSRKYKLFWGEVKITPSSFNWEEHRVSVREDWLEHSLIRQEDKRYTSDRADTICFTLNVDGQAEVTKESQMALLNFESIDKPTYNVSYFIDSDPLQTLHLIAFGRHHICPRQATRTRHTVIIPRSAPPFRLHLRIANARHDDPEKVFRPVGQIITLELPNSL